MKKKELSFFSYILPLITIIPAAFFIHLLYTWFYGIDSLYLFIVGGSISAIVCSLVGMLLIKIFSLHIEKHWLIYLISIIAAVVIDVVSHMLFIRLNIFYGSLEDCTSNIAVIITSIIFEYVILNRKVKSLSEKIVLILINPVNHYMVTLFFVSLKRFLYFNMEPLN